MEDAVDALKMAFSVFVFVIALSIVFSMFSQAREVSDIVVAHSDRRYFTEWTGAQNEDNNRTVGVETVIPTLYRYYKEKFSVDMNGRSGNIEEKFDEEIERGVRNNSKLTETETYRERYGYLYRENSNVTSVSVPWLGSSATSENGLNVDIQRRVDLYISGKSGTINDIDVGRYKNNGLNWNAKYIESFTQKYNGQRKTFDDGATINIIKGTTKLYITYQES